MSLQSSGEIIDKILVVVNNEIILNSDLKKLELKINKNEPIDELLLEGQGLESLKGNRTQQINYLINEKILESEIKRLNLSIGSDRVESEIKEMAKKNKMTRDELVSVLKTQGISLSSYQEMLRTQIERQTLVMQEVSSKIRISEDEVYSYYAQQNPNSKSAIYEYQISHILFNPKKGSAVQAKERAEKVLAKLKEGKNFEELAEQNSEDPNFTNGGALGTFKTGELGSEMEAALKNLEVGQFSNVVQTKNSFHILKIIGKKQISDPKFAAEKEKIRNLLLDKNFQKQFKTWLDNKKSESFIKIND